MTLFELAGWTLAVLGAAALGLLAGGEGAAAAASWIPLLLLLRSLWRRRMEVPPADETTVTYHLARREAFAEVALRPAVRALVVMIVVFGLPALFALGARVAGGTRVAPSLRWTHVVLLAVLSPLLVHAGAVIVKACRALRDRERGLGWSNSGIAARIGTHRWTMRRDSMQRRRWKDLVLLIDDAGNVLAVPRDLAVRAGVTGEDRAPGE